METTKQEETKKQNWTDEAIATTAKKHESRASFAKHDQSAYQAARRKGVDFLNKVCEHMPAKKRGRKQGQKAKVKAPTVTSTPTTDSVSTNVEASAVNVNQGVTV